MFRPIGMGKKWLGTHTETRDPCGIYGGLCGACPGAWLPLPHPSPSSPPHTLAPRTLPSRLPACNPSSQTPRAREPDLQQMVPGAVQVSLKLDFGAGQPPDGWQ